VSRLRRNHDDDDCHQPVADKREFVLVCIEVYMGNCSS
jgi:hypothetical protein